MTNAIVIGGGILGTATAWRLAEAGMTVTILEAGPTTGAGASRASFAWLNSSNKRPKSYHQLNVDGMNHYRQLQGELSSPRWLHFDGHIEWGRQEVIREKVARLNAWGYTAELLPISELGGLEPDLIAPGHIEEFAWYPQEGYIDPVDMIGDFTSLARRAGAKIVPNTRVSRLLTKGDRITGVETANGERHYADVVISATGALSPRLLGQVGIDLAMAPTTGMVAVTSPSPVRLRAVHHDDLMHIRPDGAGRIMMRHYDFDDMVTPETPELPTHPFLGDLLARVVTVLPNLASARIDAIRITTRPIPGDGQPVIGGVPGLDGLYVMVTHSGVTMGPMLGQIAAREITTGRSDPRLAPFRPDRTIVRATTPIREN